MKLHTQYKIVIVIFVTSLLMYAVFVSYKYNMENFAENAPTPSPQVALFFATWCGHCTSYEKSGIFDKTAQIVKNDPSLSKIKFVKYDYDLNKGLANKYQINAFPSIVFIDENGNKTKDYNKDIYSSVDLVSFAKDSIAS